ncbi:MAG TPA: DUF1499 domain-containing protein [Candidatus Binatia bacterium]|nr:DUF1499 domain-containing protein [Candidatus Binatia bacterium]
MSPERPRRTFVDTLGLIAVGLMVAGPLLAWLRLVPGLAGFGLYALGGLLAIVATIAAIVAAVRGRGFGAGRVIAVVGALVFVLTASAGRGAPAINDFTTDLDDPPAYRQAALASANSGRDMGYPSDFATQQRACCADLRPARLPVAPDQAFARARRTAEAMPSWEIVAADPTTGTIEAVATSKVFGFHDDVVIRVRPDGGGSRIDMRSKSRDGRGDLGANANRIRAYVTAVEAPS